MDDHSTVAAEFPGITKKIRDEAWGSSEGHFQRSSLYMSMKAILQHSLALQLGVGRYKSFYKTFMLKFLIVAYNDCPQLGIDLLSQVMAKLARRIEKLSGMRIADDIADLYKATVEEAKRMIRMIRRKIEREIKKNQKKEEEDSKLPLLSGLDFESDIIYKVPKLDEYLNEREQNMAQTGESFKNSAISSYGRYFDSGIPNVDLLTKLNEVTREIDHRVFWIDFERIILYQANIEDNRWSAEDLRAWSFAYAKFAEIHYRNNQLFISRMLLVRLKMIAMLDAQATKECPMLQGHRIGVNPQMIECLLLPQSMDMSIAHDIETYLCKRNDDANGPSLIEEKEASECSFAVKFAKDNAEMQQIRDAILDIENEKTEQKKKKFDEEREKAEKLKREAEAMSCDQSTYRVSVYKDRHSADCKKCALKRQAKEMCVKPFVRLLPGDEMLQHAILFELKIPDVIACLRDVLYRFAEFCHGEPKATKTKGNWIDTKISRYNSSKSIHVKLGYTEKQNTDAVYVLEDSMKKLILPNTSDCVYHGNNRQMWSSSSLRLIKNFCTLQLRNEYNGLGWTLHNTQYTENQVLASQSKCGTDLTLSEYKNFGILRADGNRLRIRKLYAMIATEGLSFEKEDVLALVMQSLWECEASGEGGFVRESHIDLRDPKFCDAMIDLLETVFVQQTNNWMHPFKLLTLTLIAVRAFEINDTEALVKKLAKLLCDIRKTALAWMETIEKKIRDMINPDESTERNLRLKLIYVSIIGGLTFFIHPKHKFYRNLFANYADSKTAVASWLCFIISTKNNIRMYTSDEGKLPGNLRMFVRLMESVGVSMEEKVTNVIERNAEFILELIKKHWSRAEYAIFSNIYFDHQFQQIFVAKATVNATEQIVTIDVITGDFLVDSLPISRLPSAVVNSDVYQWFFADVVFEVQPDAQHNFSTVQKYDECSYEFKMMGENNVIIVERKVNVFEKELIDQRIFCDFPFYLANDYSHWWNKTEDCIEFRRRTFGKKHFSKETTVEYRLNLISKHLIHVQSARPILDIKSDSYKKIINQLSRLEHRRHIHVLYDDESDDATVDLLRMNLKFSVKCARESRNSENPKKSKKSDKYELISNEFNGMRVSRVQNIGTLFGLKHGLVLESIKDEKKIVLIPNGTVHNTTKNFFAEVSISMKNDLRSPHFYQYQVDKFCCQLKSSNGSHASWLFLAYLHAITSYGQIEKFTRMTGTERAIQILQSALVWSSSPYDAEAIRILKDIATLSPNRKLNDSGVQSVAWPRGISTHAAQDCFVFIAKKLLDDSQRLRCLHGDSSDKHIDPNTDMKLNKRDHRRCQQLNPNLNVSDTFIKHKELRTAPLQERLSFSDDTRRVCTLYHKRQFQVSTICPHFEQLSTKTKYF